MPDIEALIQRWRKGDERTAEILYNHFRDSTFRLAYGLLGDLNDAEEAAQDALTYALVNIHRYDHRRASFSTWLHTIAVCRCRDRYRRNRLKKFSLTAWIGGDEGLSDPHPGPEHHAIHAETSSQVWEAVQGLSLPLREAILLRYWSGHTFREMADILGCPVPTAQSRVRLAYQRLRATLAPTELVHLEEEESR